MSGIIYANQLASWICRRYLRFVLMGAVTCCAVINLALHAGAGLRYYCAEECIGQLIVRPLVSLDKDVISYIRENVVDPPFPLDAYKPNFPIDNPPWSILGKWGEAHKFINNYFKGYQDGTGKFVEVGAQDGEFMSMTIWLEKVKKFQGLLVEPNPIDYEKLRARKRASMSINACAVPDVSHRKDFLWLRDTPENLPPLLTRVQSGSNRLIQYVSSEDKELGKTVRVQCYNLGAMIVAAFKSVIIDFLSISTHGGELDILANIPSGIHFRVIYIMAPLPSQDDADQLAMAMKKRGMARSFSMSNLHIYIPKGEVAIVDG